MTIQLAQIADPEGQSLYVAAHISGQSTISQPVLQISIRPYKGVGFIRGLIQGLIDGALQNLMFLYIELMLKHFKY